MFSQITHSLMVLTWSRTKTVVVLKPEIYQLFTTIYTLSAVSLVFLNQLGLSYRIRIVKNSSQLYHCKHHMNTSENWRLHVYSTAQGMRCSVLWKCMFCAGCSLDSDCVCFQLLESVWIVLKGNINLAMTLLTTGISFVLGGGTALLNFIISIVSTHLYLEGKLLSSTSSSLL